MALRVVFAFVLPLRFPRALPFSLPCRRRGAPDRDSDPAGCRSMQRRVVANIFGVRVGAAGDQQLYRSWVAIASDYSVCSQVQRGLVVTGCAVRVVAGGQQ